MFSFRRKIRAAHIAYLWGAKNATSGFSERLTLSVQVDEGGDAIRLSVQKVFFGFWHFSDSLELEPGEVYSVNLCRAINVTAHTNKSGDAFVSCVLMPSM